MKKIIITCSLFASLWTQAQDLSYGVVLGIDKYMSASRSGSFPSTQDSPAALNLGVYLDYGFTSKLGIKTEVTFNKRELRQYYPFTASYELNIIEICPNLKWDFNKEYRKGWYMLIGPKLDLITKATAEG